MPSTTKKQEEWRHIVEIQQTSGLSIKQFCQQHNLSEQSFYKAKARLKARDKLNEADSTASVQNEFIAIQSVSTIAQSNAAIKVTTEAATISLPITISPQWLAHLLKEIAR